VRTETRNIEASSSFVMYVVIKGSTVSKNLCSPLIYFLTLPQSSWLLEDAV
jgi:hypothetical protein